MYKQNTQVQVLPLVKLSEKRRNNIFGVDGAAQVSLPESNDLYRCGRTIGLLTVGDFAAMGVQLVLFAFIVSS